MHGRQGITQVVSRATRFLANPKKYKMVVAKRIFRYVKGTKDYGLWYPCKGNFELSVFTNVDWVGNIDVRKSTTGGVFFLKGRQVA